MHVDYPLGVDVLMSWNFGPATFGLGDMTLTLCVSGGDLSTLCRSLSDLVSFLVVDVPLCCVLQLYMKVSGVYQVAERQVSSIRDRYLADREAFKSEAIYVLQFAAYSQDSLNDTIHLLNSDLVTLASRYYYSLQAYKLVIQIMSANYSSTSFPTWLFSTQEGFGPCLTTIDNTLNTLEEFIQAMDSNSLIPVSLTYAFVDDATSIGDHCWGDYFTMGQVILDELEPRISYEDLVQTFANIVKSPTQMDITMYQSKADIEYYLLQYMSGALTKLELSDKLSPVLLDEANLRGRSAIESLISNKIEPLSLAIQKLKDRIFEDYTTFLEEMSRLAIFYNYDPYLQTISGLTIWRRPLVSLEGSSYQIYYTASPNEVPYGTGIDHEYILQEHIQAVLEDTEDILGDTRRILEDEKGKLSTQIMEASRVLMGRLTQGNMDAEFIK